MPGSRGGSQACTHAALSSYLIVTAQKYMKAVCLEFSVSHADEFIANRAGLELLGIDLFQKVVAERAVRTGPPPEPRRVWSITCATTQYCIDIRC